MKSPLKLRTLLALEKIGNGMTTQKQIKCPYCRKVQVEMGSAHWPFCSERCRSLDLGAWASEKYRVAGEEISQSEVDEFSDDSPSPITKKE